jgi:glucose-6-phosphate 1-dehydrogenase
MTSRVIPVAPFVLTVFGATGDLARRKLLPASFHRDFDGQLPEAAIILGAARRPMSRDEFVALARDAIVEHISASQTGGPELDRFLARLLFVAVDAEGEDGWIQLASAMVPLPIAFRSTTSPRRRSRLAARLSPALRSASRWLRVPDLNPSRTPLALERAQVDVISYADVSLG